MTTNPIFFNQVFDKKRLKVLIAWVFKEFGEKQALRVVEELKTIGFHNATQAGLSIGLNDLTTPSQKSSLLSKAEFDMSICDQDFNGGRITATERNQRIVDTWHRVSETLRKQVVEHFSTYDQLNPVYIMALSGARGNFSQVRQLVGMRGLMADPQGQIISFPIRSNLREGLTLTEYFISCSGARKGLVDTALRTADTGYLTRRLVDVSHHIVIKKICCNTEKGIIVRALKGENKLLLSLSGRLVGRVLAQNIEYPGGNSQKDTKTIQNEESQAFRMESLETFTSQGKADSHTTFLAQKNQEIDPTLAFKIQTVQEQVMIRSPLTCNLTHSICQLCYGWSLSQGKLVSLGEAVGVIAAQSIGEPGTQLTMRTFHTGGVFSGDLLQEIKAPHSGKIEFAKAFQGLMIRTTDGRIAFLTKTSGEILLKSNLKEKSKNTLLPFSNPFVNLINPRIRLLRWLFASSVDFNSKVFDSRVRKHTHAQSKYKRIYPTSLIVREFCEGVMYGNSHTLLNRAESKEPSTKGGFVQAKICKVYLKSKYNLLILAGRHSSKSYNDNSILRRPLTTKTKDTASLQLAENSQSQTQHLKSQVENKNYIVLLLNDSEHKVILFNKLTKYCLLYNDNKLKKKTNKTNFNSNEREAATKQTCLQFQALSLLFVRQAEYVNKNQLLAQISLLGEEGNQPIKSRQTIFAELSGKVFETQGAVSSKKVIKNINKSSKNAETIVFKHELVNTLKGRASNSIQPEKSTKLGFFHILAIQTAATFGVNGFQIPGAIHSLDFAEIKTDKRNLSDFRVRSKVAEVKPSLSLSNGKSSEKKATWFFRHGKTGGEPPQSFFGETPQGFLETSHGVGGRAKQSFANVAKIRSFPPRSGESEGGSIQAIHTGSRTESSIGFKTLDSFAGRSKLPRGFISQDFSNGKPRFSKSWEDDSTFQLPVLRSDTVTSFTSPSLYQRSTMGLRDLKKHHKIQSCYNPYTAQFFSSTHNKNVIVALLKRQSSKVKKMKEGDSTASSSSTGKPVGVIQKALVEKGRQTLQRQSHSESLLSSSQERQEQIGTYSTNLSSFTAFKQSKFYDQKQQNSDYFFLRTIAQEGDLVDSDYKKYLS